MSLKKSTTKDIIQSEWEKIEAKILFADNLSEKELNDLEVKSNVWFRLLQNEN